MIDKHDFQAQSISMTETPPTQPTISLDDHDTAAVVAILIRAVRIEDELERAEAQIAELNAKIAAGKAMRTKIVAALNIFGFNTAETGYWKRVRKSLGDPVYDNAVGIARETAPDHSDDSAKVKSSEQGKGAAAMGRDDLSQKANKATIPQAIMELLKIKSAEGAPISEIRDYLKAAHDLKVHEKSPGMTLFRLQKQGLVKRDGRKWFFVADRDESEEEKVGARIAAKSDTRQGKTAAGR